jgi:hypothetical protein
MSFSAGGTDRVGVIRVGQPGEISRLPSRRRSRVDRRPLDSAAALVGIIGDAAVRAFALARAHSILDDVGGVVGDDVHVEFHAARVDRVDQRLEVGVGAEVRVDPGEIGDPIAVIAGAFLARRALHRLVLEDRRSQTACRAEPWI